MHKLKVFPMERSIETKKKLLEKLFPELKLSVVEDSLKSQINLIEKIISEFRGLTLEEVYSAIEKTPNVKETRDNLKTYCVQEKLFDHFKNAVAKNDLFYLQLICMLGFNVNYESSKEFAKGYNFKASSSSGLLGTITSLINNESLTIYVRGCLPAIYIILQSDIVSQNRINMLKVLMNYQVDLSKTFSLVLSKEPSNETEYKDLKFDEKLYRFQIHPQNQGRNLFDNEIISWLRSSVIDYLDEISLYQQIVAYQGDCSKLKRPPIADGLTYRLDLAKSQIFFNNGNSFNMSPQMVMLVRASASPHIEPSSRTTLS